MRLTILRPSRSSAFRLVPCVCACFYPSNARLTPGHVSWLTSSCANPTAFFAISSWAFLPHERYFVPESFRVFPLVEAAERNAAGVGVFVGVCGVVSLALVCERVGHTHRALFVVGNIGWQLCCQNYHPHIPPVSPTPSLTTHSLIQKTVLCLSAPATTQRGRNAARAVDKRLPTRCAGSIPPRHNCDAASPPRHTRSTNARTEPMVIWPRVSAPAPPLM